MKDTQTPSQRLLGEFVPVMENEGFAYRKSGHRFVKSFAHGTYEYCLSFDNRGGFIRVDASFQVHFDSLEKLFNKIVDFECGWSAGATLRTAGAEPWKTSLSDERFDSLTIKERAGFATNELYPDCKIQQARRFLFDGYKKYAAPLFGRLRTYRDLAEFFRESRSAGFGSRKTWHPKNSWNQIGRCWPTRAEFCVYLSLILAAYLGEDLGEIVEFAKNCDSTIPGRSVSEIVNGLLEHFRTADCARLLK